MHRTFGPSTFLVPSTKIGISKLHTFSGRYHQNPRSISVIPHTSNFQPAEVSGLDLGLSLADVVTMDPMEGGKTAVALDAAVRFKYRYPATRFVRTAIRVWHFPIQFECLNRIIFPNCRGKLVESPRHINFGGRVVSHQPKYHTDHMA